MSATVNIVQKPTTPNAAYTSLLYVVTGSSTTINNPQYSFVMDIYESGSSTRLNRVTQVPNSEQAATFDVSRFVQSQLEYDNNWKTNGKARYTNAVKDFTFKFGEQYGTSISSSITVYPNLDTDTIRVFPGYVDPNNGSSYNFNTSSFNPPFSSGNTYLTNFPGAQSTELFPEPNGYPYIVDASDYMTITEFEDSYAVNNTRVIGRKIQDGDLSAITFDINLPNPNPSASAEDRQFITTGIGPKNLSEFSAEASASIASGDTNVIFSARDVGGVILMINNNWDGSQVKGSDYSQAWDFNKTIQPQGKEYTRFAFINQYGFYDYYNVYSPLRRESSLERNNVILPKVDYSSRVSSYNVMNGGETSFYTDTNDSYSITTQWIDKEIANWLEELLESPEVFIQQEDEFVPIVITDKNYTSNQSTARNKTFQYTINFKPANGRDLYSRQVSPPGTMPPFTASYGPALWYDFTDESTMYLTGSNNDEIWAISSKGDWPDALVKGSGSLKYGPSYWVAPKLITDTNSIGQTVKYAYFNGRANKSGVPGYAKNSTLSSYYDSASYNDIGYTGSGGYRPGEMFGGDQDFTWLAFFEPLVYHQNENLQGAQASEIVSFRTNPNGGSINGNATSYQLVDQLNYTGSTFDPEISASYLSTVTSYISGSMTETTAVGPGADNIILQDIYSYSGSSAPGWTSAFGVQRYTTSATLEHGRQPSELTKLHYPAVGNNVIETGSFLDSNERFTVGSFARTNTLGGGNFNLSQVLYYTSSLSDAQIEEIIADFNSSTYYNLNSTTN